MKQKDLRLLVCDPDPGSRDQIQEFLSEFPIDVFFTTPGDPFRSVLALHAPFNAAVIDVSNTSQRCRDLMKAVREISPETRIIFLSRLADEDLWSEVLGLGAYDLLAKPPDRQEFLRSVLSAVKQHAA